MNELEMDNDPPSGILQEVTNAPLNLLPKKSRELYEKRYKEFVRWANSRKVKNYSENVLLAFFSEKSKMLKPSSLWSVYSMLKTTLLIKENIDIAKYNTLIGFLRKEAVGYVPKKSKILSRNEIIQFLREAPDYKYLMIKVALIFGISGGCRRNELYKLKETDIIDKGSILFIKISGTKTRTFTVMMSIDDQYDGGVNFIQIYRKYAALRKGKTAAAKNFFLRYEKGECRNQVIGVNTFGRLPQIIAEYLKLDHPNLYTGNCFRRSYANAPVATMIRVDEAAMAATKYDKWEPSSPTTTIKVEESFTPTPLIISTNDPFMDHPADDDDDAPAADGDEVSNVLQSSSSTSTLLSTLGKNGLIIQNCPNITINLTIKHCEHDV